MKKILGIVGIVGIISILLCIPDKTDRAIALSTYLILAIVSITVYIRHRTDNKLRGRRSQHSIGLPYDKLLVAIDSDDLKEEKAAWNKNYFKVINKNRAIALFTYLKKTLWNN